MEIDRAIYLNHKNNDLETFAPLNANDYCNAIPFPNIHFENFFDPVFLETVVNEFPDLIKIDSIKYQNKREIKFAGKGERFFGANTRNLMHYLNSEPFLNFLQILTGIKEPLIGDPYFIGGGQHEIKKGGLLKVHADFNKHPNFNLDRRINVLIYLNKDWKEDYGGHLELWNKDMDKCEKRILPLFNTLAIFSTNDFSNHGHPNPLNCPDGISRKSLALYYYTNGRPSNEINQGAKEHSTLFKERKGNIDDKIAMKERPKWQLKSFIKDFIPPVVIKILKVAIKRMRN